MKLSDYLKSEIKNVSTIKESMETEEETTAKNLSDAEYFDTIDPLTGFRFAIPLLNPSSPSYYWDYIYYMKIRATAPETFKKIMEWN